MCIYNAATGATAQAIEPASFTARSFAPAVVEDTPKINSNSSDPEQIRLLQDALAKGLLG
jgi:hypothetical protein